MEVDRYCQGCPVLGGPELEGGTDCPISNTFLCRYKRLGNAIEELCAAVKDGMTATDEELAESLRRIRKLFRDKND